MHCKNKNFVPDFVLLSRILYIANIGKINHTASYAVYLLFFLALLQFLLSSCNAAPEVAADCLQQKTFLF